jgi:prepilin peptidase CpaA
MPDWLPNVVALTALACVLIAAFWDVRHFEIPDELSIALIVLAVIFGLLTPGFSWVSHILSPVAVFAVGLLLFAKGWMGGGDVKLIAAIAAWTGHLGLLPFLVGVSLSGGVLALVLIVARRVYAGRVGPRILAADAPLPYAVAIAGGAIWWGFVTWPLV